MGGLQRQNSTVGRNSMRPPARPTPSSHPSHSGRAPSPADSLISSAVVNGLKRKERDFDHDTGAETNINVVVRCRGRSDREVRENSGVVVSTNGVRGKNVELSMGPNAISNKTYQFDKVFSPAADQTIIFEDVVLPILNEMLSGFNCTIFAYGQTGTGKTYTMSGDMTDTLGLLSDAAGIIPRVLYSLFQKLEADEVECVVKCSFIELYNEELRDLLASDDSVKLKIYDDANKKSHTATMVQGMEESHIKSAAAGVKLLQQGSLRRQVAATKCNDLSSRSHTVFTITTFIKKPNEGAEDYICSGKLNLVDLAGSENIQRSGAENKRAAEAGLINKSLLTLGRVINALVDKSQHIPYRESKLTRLLQDSLGGRTKTCIIATVSPSRSNLEETISTLDYAFRAKNIRNKPQVNTLISKRTLLKEFTAEIEKLKSELIATRQRNGVYLSNEQYEEITIESESRRILSDEQKSRIETLEISLRSKVQELFNLTSKFMNLKKDNEVARIDLEGTKNVLEKTELVLGNTQHLLEEEQTLRQAHQLTEDKLRKVGTTLISTIGQSTRDLDGVHSKLKRRSDLHNRNRRTWQSSSSRIASVSDRIDRFLENFTVSHEELLDTVSIRVQDLVSAETGKLEQCKNLLLSKTADIEKAHVTAKQQSTSAKENMNEVLEEIKILREEVKQKVGDGLKGLNDAAARISGEVISELDHFQTQLYTSYSGLGKDFKTLLEDLNKAMLAQRAENDRLKDALHEANRRNITESLKAATQLQTCLEDEKKASQRERQILKEQILSLIDSSSKRQDDRLETNFLQVQGQLVESVEAFEQADRDYLDGMDIWAGEDDNLLDKVNKSKDDLKGKMKRDWTAINARNTAIQTSTKAVHAETIKIVDAQLQEMAIQMAALDGFVTRARDQNDVHHDKHLNSLEQLASQMSDACKHVNNSFEARASNFSVFVHDNEANASEMRDLLSGLEKEVRLPMQSIASDMSQTPLEEYVPTGQTPQRKEWAYPTDLPATENHQSILARLHGLPDPHIPTTTYTPAKSPKKRTSPIKAHSSPSKTSSPTKPKIYNDNIHVNPSGTAAPNGNRVPTSLLATGDLPPRPNSKTDDSATDTITTTNAAPSTTIQAALPAKQSLKELDANIVSRPTSAGSLISSSNNTSSAANSNNHLLTDFAPSHFSKSLGGGGLQQPPLKRHATVIGVTGLSSSLMINGGSGGGGMESKLPTMTNSIRSAAVHGRSGKGLMYPGALSQSIGPGAIVGGRGDGERGGGGGGGGNGGNGGNGRWLRSSGSH